MFTINPPREPIADSRGNVTPSWYRFFAQLQRVTGQTDNPIDDTSLLIAVPLGGATIDLGDDSIAPSLIPQHDEQDIPAPICSPSEFDDLLPPLRYGV